MSVNDIGQIQRVTEGWVTIIVPGEGNLLADWTGYQCRLRT